MTVPVLMELNLAQRAWIPTQPGLPHPVIAAADQRQRAGSVVGPQPNLRATMTHMELVGIREMRQNLSRYAQRARHGESFLITDRGQEIAQLTPAPSRASAIDRLVAERGARRGQGSLLDVLEDLPEPIPGPPSNEVLDELRSERQ